MAAPWLRSVHQSSDAIVVTAVNDVFVLNAWAEASGAGEKGIEFLADGNGDFARALGLTYEGVANGLGTRSQRYAMVVEDGVVGVLNIEDAPSKADVSGGGQSAADDGRGSTVSLPSLRP